ncbi:diaminopimelate epimerase [Carboxylicivirga linearis]|nr:diaminopimelate epimerase [Carboxylicivirga linearis]
MIDFYKYQGTGNDFVIIDNRDNHFDGCNTETVRFLCDRRFGVGGDGLMLLENHAEYDFTMRYFNSDGNEASMCGNGGRCIAAFAVHLNIVPAKETFQFMAVDGLHEAKYDDGIVSLKMIDVKNVDANDDYTFLDTGSPHFVQFHESVENLNINKMGSEVRYSDTFMPGGTNANFVHFINDNTIKVRTYERGVENETLACGTGVVASAISAHLKKKDINEFNVDVLGGKLKVSFEPNADGGFNNIWLVGPATFVFKGTIEV